MAEVKTTFSESLAGITENQSQVRERPCMQGPYTESSDLNRFLVKEIRRVIELIREIKTADQHGYKFLLIQQIKLFRLNVN